MNRLATATLSLFLVLPWPTASACGGFFCSQSAPVVQSGERIVFADNGDGTITAVIEIVYAGPSQRFSWVLPVTGTPTIGIAATSLFTSLDAATVPSLVRSLEGSPCNFGFGSGGGCGMVCGAAAGTSGGDLYAPPPASAWDGGVAVLEDGSVGPYDYVVLSIDPMLPTPADTARTWLTAQGYDVSTEGAAVLGDYLAAGQNLVAFRLTKSASSGSIRPITMTYPSTVGVIPIKPTAVAAQLGMGVRVYMIGPSRAVPVSYDEIELSDAAIDWTNPNASYPSAVAGAVDEAGGHAFVTEYAGALSPDPSITTRAIQMRMQLEQLRDQLPTWTGSDAGWVNSGVLAFQYDEGLADAIAAAVPGLDASVRQSLIACPWCVTLGPTIPGFDAAAYIAALEDFVVKPLEVAVRVRGGGYVTRLSTSLDPAEMTVDPVFAFATGYPDVDADRNAALLLTCTDYSTGVGAVRLPGGTTYDPARLAAATPTFGRRWDYQLDGSRTLVADNTSTIAAALAAAAPSASTMLSITRSPLARGHAGRGPSLGVVAASAACVVGWWRRRRRAYARDRVLGSAR